MSIPAWRSVSNRRAFMQIAAATTGEVREPDAGCNGSDRIACSAGARDALARGDASHVGNVAGHVSERGLVAELLRLSEQPLDLRYPLRISSCSGALDRAASANPPSHRVWVARISYVC